MSEQQNNVTPKGFVAADTALGAGVVATPPGSNPDFKTIVLPSNAVATIRLRAKGKDIRAAARMMRKEFAHDPVEGHFARIACRATYNGQALTIEEIDELPEDDVAEMLAVITGKAPASPSDT